MPDSKTSSFLDLLNPLARFSSVTEFTVDRDSHTAREHHAESTLRILSWNINKSNDSQHWQREFRQLLTQYQPDKIFLQEVRVCAAAAHTDDKNAFGLSHIEPNLSWSFAPNFIDSVTNTYSGVLTATNTRRISSQSLTTEHTEPILQTPKATLFAEYALSACSESLLTVNTHLINFVSLGKFEAQLRSIESVLTQHTGAVILSGDFNTWNAARWQLLTNMAARLALKPVSFNNQDTEKIKSFLLSPPLDHIFYRGFKQSPQSSTVIDYLSSSDHYPLVVELSCP